ncbi:hypothetical protein L226DRAFT_474393 [Lentinus tigrinus ALCF2SS1-7]|uniref:F-box domain-containing protein n=1 Tax=Lentinus tigrinus ALCF2SS1-6 TaxID=1328759 RepID=A0A5C2S4M9_9APHY|nr:hypothetical protein L227DRAFT_505998 [Lentinus tigrinus ALCF2SS1-6]RPD67765.1 hypothetical protein L226DRAFT_474443 [Lentinus tigrinus ALCF2SS1-7]RPD67798.1 hypothetical protein L226DRAFT_474393 [Lentinus tigrinus ALCF2SS1-7]
MSVVDPTNNCSAQVGLRITSSADLDSFGDRAAARPSVGRRLEDLRVIIYEQFSVASLQRCLCLAPNLVDLDLLLSLPDSDVPGILDNIILPELRFFRTNIPHALLRPFLAAHDRMSILTLDACSSTESPCPLSASHLPHLKCVTGPAPCVSSFVNQGTFRLTMSSPDGACSTSLLLRSLPLPLPSLYALTIDFPANDHDVLLSVVASCSGVRKLKLMEKPSHKCRRGRLSTRRAWNDTTTWSKALLGLPLLEEFMLRTTSKLVQRSGSEDEERKTFVRWTSGLRSATRGQPNHHPALYHIGVWYSADDDDRGVVTHWSKCGQNWCHMSTMLNPPQGYEFI